MTFLRFFDNSDWLIFIHRIFLNIAHGLNLTLRLCTSVRRRSLSILTTTCGHLWISTCILLWFILEAIIEVRTLPICYSIQFLLSTVLLWSVTWRWLALTGTCSNDGSVTNLKDLLNTHLVDVHWLLLLSFDLLKHLCLSRYSFLSFF